MGSNLNSVFCAYDNYKTAEKSKKHNWDYSLGIHINWGTKRLTDETKCAPIFVAESNMPISVSNGAFGVKLGIIAMTNADAADGNWCPRNGGVGGATYLGLTSWKAELRVGDYYYYNTIGTDMTVTSEGWTKTKSTFTLLTGDESDFTSNHGEGAAISFKDVDEDPQGCEGYMAKVTSPMFGKVSLKVFNKSFNYISSTDQYSGYVFLKDISVKWYSTVQEVNTDVNTYKQTASTYATDDLDVSLDMASYYNNKFGNGLIVGTDNKYISQLAPSLQELTAQCPEELLLERMVPMYSQSRRRLTVSLRMQDDLDYRGIYQYDSQFWVVTNKEYKYRDGIVKTTIQSIN